MKLMTLITMLVFSATNLGIGQDVERATLNLVDGSTILHIKSPAKTDGSYIHQVFFREAGSHDVLLWSQDIHLSSETGGTRQLQKVIAGSRLKNEIRLIADFNMDRMPVWNFKLENGEVIKENRMNLQILHFLEAGSNILTTIDSYMLGRAKASQAEVMKNVAVLSRGQADLSLIHFSNFNIVEVLWKDGDKDVVKLHPGGVASVVNAKEKIPGIDGVTREWSPGPPVELRPSRHSDLLKKLRSDPNKK